MSKLNEPSSSLPERSIADALSTRRKALTAEEVAEMLGVAQSTIYDMARARRIPHFRINLSIRFDPKELADWLREKKVA